MNLLERSTGLLLAFVLLPVIALGQEPSFEADAPLPVSAQVTIGELENGLRYYIRANERPENRAELRLVVNVGSILEDEDQKGLAHFVEHMAFNGTKNFERQELVRYLESIGMRFGPDLNAYTSFDETVYMLTVPTDRDDALPMAFQILADWANGITFDPEEIEKERGVVIEEWRGRLGAQSRLADAQIPVLLQGSRYAERLPIGRVEVLEIFPHETLTRFYEQWYRPDLMAVVAVGDFDPEEVLALIVDRFGSVDPVDGSERPIFAVPDHSETLFHIATDPELTTTRVEVRYKLPTRRVETVAHQTRVLTERLYSAMLNARLSELTQRPNAPFLAASTGRGGLVRTSDMYSLVALVADGGAARGLETLLVETERVARHGFTEGELQRAKLNLLRSLERAYAERSRTNSGVYANAYTNHFLTGMPISGIAYEYALARAVIPQVSLDDVNRLAGEWIGGANRVVMVSAPAKDGIELPREAELLAVMGNVTTANVAPYDDADVAGALVAQIPSGSSIVEEREHPSVDVTEWRLGNGVRVLVKPTDFRDDEVVMRAYSRGGLSLASDDEYVSAEFATELVRASGIGSFSAIELQRALAGKAVSVSPFIGQMEHGFSGSASPRDLETLLQLVYLHFTSLREDSIAVAATIEQIDAFLANRSADPNAAFSDTLQVTLNQYHRRARPPTAELLAELDPRMAYRFFQNRFEDAYGFTFVFVGNLDLDELRALVETYLGALPARGREETWRDHGIRPPAGVVEKVVRQGIEPRSHTRLIFTGRVPFDRQRSHAVRTLASILDMRLMDVLREDLGATYGVQVSGSLSREPEERYTFGIAFGAAPDRLEELVAVTFAEIERIKVDGPDPAVLVRVKEIQRRERETSLRQNGFWVGQITAYDRDGRDFMDILTADQLIESTTPEIIRDAAREILDPEQYIRVSLSPAD
jgi:zinc protease